ncbi:hypothetical protein Vretimale_4873 [Volvox reticuliferus]|nr:hypothetical protein Vretifemale_3499 [Volvox reticuliferus]GIL99736.1 hypothetical protein Vretimale_4873 [Volvox reticuliferus]
MSLEERIAVAHPGAASSRPRPVLPDDLTFLLTRHADAIRSRGRAEGGALSHFEVVTALAFRYFADCSVDLAVVETGLGGITDATNVFQPASLQTAVITGLGMEHVEALGGSLQSIAAAKAGILRSGRPLVLGRQVYDEAEQVVVAEAEAKGCRPVLRAERVVSVQSDGLEIDLARSGQIIRERLKLALLPHPELDSPSADSRNVETRINRSTSCLGDTSSNGRIDGGSAVLNATVGLVGPHQHDNVAAAVAAARVLRSQGWVLPDEALVAGLREAHLAGRFQVVKLPGTDGPFVVLDGAHTAESATALATCLRTAFPGPGPGFGSAATTRIDPYTSAGSSCSASASAGTSGGDFGCSGGGAGIATGDHPVALILAMADDKDHRGVVMALRAMQPRVVVFTSVPIAGSYRRAAAPGTLAGHWQAAAILAAPSHRPFRCRELVQASLGSAFEKARQELRGVRAGMGLGPGQGSPGIILVTGSLHAVAQAHKISELQPLLLGA